MKPQPRFKCYLYHNFFFSLSILLSQFKQSKLYFPAGLKHRSQVRSGHRSGQVAGQVRSDQVNRRNIFLPRRLTIFLGYLVLSTELIM